MNSDDDKIKGQKMKQIRQAKSIKGYSPLFAYNQSSLTPLVFEFMQNSRPDTFFVQTPFLYRIYAKFKT